jgi:hypothetical protein
MYSIDQRTLVNELSIRCRDIHHSRWRVEEKYTAINHAVQKWGNRVAFPVQELLSNLWDDQTYAYSIPSYVDLSTLRIQRNETDPTGNANVGRWVDVQADVVPTSDGAGWQIVSRVRPIDATTARLFWYTSNGYLPYPFPSLSSNLSDNATSLTLNNAIQFLAPVGYILIDSEWIGYRGVVVSPTTTTLQNLTRGVYNTTPASHSSGASVIWGITVLDKRLYEQLHNEAQKFLHQLSLQNAAEQAREFHERMVSHHRVLADEFWVSYFNPAWGGTRQRKVTKAS